MGLVQPNGHSPSLTSAEYSGHRQHRFDRSSVSKASQAEQEFEGAILHTRDELLPCEIPRSQRDFANKVANTMTFQQTTAV
jgi:hypothetical protein